MVYQLLDANGLCTYYQLNDHPGISRRIGVRKDKFAFLDEDKMAGGLITFQNDKETHTTLYLPQIHCSSCLYLLENLHRLEKAVLSSRIDFAAKEITIVFDHRQISLRQVAELLTSIGYEPHISLRDLGQTTPGVNKTLIYQLGVAGFCFANIMLFSFPEYLGLSPAPSLPANAAGTLLSDGSELTLQHTFRLLNFLFSLPVLLYSARPFYDSAWKSLRHKFLNIDAPIVLAIFVTFARSAWEVFTGAGSGYFDSMSGIVFFMLAGRVLQDRTYRQLSFERDYTSYFPMAVTVLLPDASPSIPAASQPIPATPQSALLAPQSTRTPENKDRTSIKALPDIRSGDTLLIHNGELIPADGILTRGRALIDYSFVTGESQPVVKNIGEIVYAGGRQTGANIEVLVVKEVVQSYLTQLWNRQDKQSPVAPDHQLTDYKFSFVHALSRYFTYIVLSISAVSAIYWAIHDPSKCWGAATAVLIVACPCALLLSTTFTNGHLLRTLAKNQFYLRNARTIERIAATTHIVFDKTGTLTDTTQQDITYEGEALTPHHRLVIATLAAQSTHPLSQALVQYLDQAPTAYLTDFKEWPGKGIEGYVDGEWVTIGSPAFVTPATPASPASRVTIAIDGRPLGAFTFAIHYRPGLTDLIARLSPRLSLSVLSGDTAREHARLQQIFGKDTALLFGQSPTGKTHYIQRLQAAGKKVMMIGDGLNDAGALGQSDTGIAISADCNSFTPASDAILRADQLEQLPAFIRLCRTGHTIILASFMLSIIYNVVGISFAVHGTLSPLIAAVLMPASSLSILLVTYGSSHLAANYFLRARRPQPEPNPKHQPPTSSLRP